MTRYSVIGPDGTFLGTHVDEESQLFPCRQWIGRARDGFYERMYDLSTRASPKPKDDADAPEERRFRWFLIQIPKRRTIKEPERTSDWLDPEGIARVLSPVHALEWFKRQPFDAPEGLIAQVTDPRNAREAHPKKHQRHGARRVTVAAIRNVVADQARVRLLREQGKTLRAIMETTGLSYRQVQTIAKGLPTAPSVEHSAKDEAEYERNREGRSPGQADKKRRDPEDRDDDE